MKKNINIKNLAEFFLIFLLGVYIRYLIISNGIAFYVNPRYFNLIDAAGIVAVFVGLLGVIYELSKIKIKNKSEAKSKKENKGQIHFQKEIRKISLFMLSNILIITTLTIGLIVEPKHLSTRAVSNRSSQSQASFKDNSDNVINSFIKSYDNYEIADWLKSFNREPDLNLYQDINVNVKGFVYEADYLSEDEFIIGRFVIRCCVVDASPAGLVVNLPGWKTKYKDGDWLEVAGAFKVVDFEATKKIYIEPSNILEIDTPNNPYIY